MLLLLIVASCGVPAVDNAAVPRAASVEVRAGMDERSAVAALNAQGYLCRELKADEWSHSDERVVRTVACYRLQRVSGGTSVSYSNLGLGSAGLVVHVGTGAYVAPDDPS
jgi:hypothetical protein